MGLRPFQTLPHSGCKTNLLGNFLNEHRQTHSLASERENKFQVWKTGCHTKPGANVVSCELTLKHYLGQNESY